jgi:hypothetical protein
VKIAITREDGLTEVFEDVTDCYIAYRQETLRTDGQRAWPTLDIRSHSWGTGHLRDLVKEVQQSLVELQDFLRGQRNGANT